MLIYHAVPDRIVGTKLQPLNTLRETQPEIYAEYIKKYRGREFVLSQRVLNLDCLWNDVLHFSTVHPRLVGEALTRAGFIHKPSRWFVLDPSQHGFDRSNASIFLHAPREWGDFEDREEDLAEFSPNPLEQYKSEPAATLAYFSECKKNGTRPLMFCWVPHVLFCGKLQVSSLEIIEA